MKGQRVGRIYDPDLLRKITGMSRQAGCTVIRSAITLYVLLRESSAPLWVKGSILAALAYFICPLDAIPDFLPGGFLDDLAAMTLLLGQLRVFVDGTVQKRIDQLIPEHCRSKRPRISA